MKVKREIKSLGSQFKRLSKEDSKNLKGGWWCCGRPPRGDDDDQGEDEDDD